jgi:hypothetical protein
MGTLEQECTQKRNDILAYAKGLADDGAHYLWGANGEKPATSGSVLYAPVILDADTPEESCFCAATITVQKVVYVCAGRYRHKDLATSPPSKKVALTKGSPVNKQDPSISKILDFINKNANRPGAQVGWGSDLTPRKVKGDSITDYDTQPQTDITDGVVWGEGCDDTQHFDCGGFVRYVVRNVCGVPIGGIADNPDKKNPFGDPLGTLVAEGETVLPADILSYSGHIAFAIGATSQPYNIHTSYAVAQAESAVYGVNYGKTHSQKSQKCIRLSPSTLLNRKISAP